MQLPFNIHYFLTNGKIENHHRCFRTSRHLYCPSDEGTYQGSNLTPPVLLASIRDDKMNKSADFDYKVESTQGQCVPHLKVKERWNEKNSSHNFYNQTNSLITPYKNIIS
jgi:hypothetical protein